MQSNILFSEEKVCGCFKMCSHVNIVDPARGLQSFQTIFKICGFYGLIYITIFRDKLWEIKVKLVSKI